jgi:hypothetical protein
VARQLECIFLPDLSCLKYETFFMSLRAIVAASEVYKLLPSAIVDLKILLQYLEDMEWIPKVELSQKPDPLDGPNYRSNTFKDRL